MKQKKEKRITLRLTPEQYEAIQSKADTAQMSTGASQGGGNRRAEGVHP